MCFSPREQVAEEPKNGKTGTKGNGNSSSSHRRPWGFPSISSDPATISPGHGFLGSLAAHNTKPPLSLRARRCCPAGRHYHGGSAASSSRPAGQLLRSDRFGSGYRDGIREGSDHHVPSRACVRRLLRVYFHGGLAGCSATVSCSFPARYRAVHRDARRGTRCREGESVVPLTEPPHSPPSDDARAAERSCRLFFPPR
jgi:hypothetical protein